MKALSIVLMLVLGVGFLSAAVWLSKSQPVSTKGLPKTPQQTEAEAKAEPIPIVAAEGPFPKAVVPVTEHDFGAMQQHEEGSHQFVVKNEGAAPLEVVAREIDTSCQCTVGTVGMSPVPPGGETTVELKWEIKAPAPKFRHTAKIRTNDPENTVIEMAITGKVDKVFHLLPDALWDLGEATDDKPASATGVLFTRMKDQFDITEFVCPNPRVQCTWEPLDQEALTKHEALSGYTLTVNADMHDMIGTLRELVEIKSSDSEVSAARFELKVRKPGPTTISGLGWIAETSTLSLREFPAVKGRSVELSFFMRVEGDVQLVSTESESQVIQTSWRKDETYQPTSKAKSKTVRYILKVEVPPGPAVIRLREDAEKLKLKFDHPQLGEMTIFVSYLSI